MSDMRMTKVHMNVGFIRSGKSGKKVPFTQGVMESQGKSGNLKIFA